MRWKTKVCMPVIRASGTCNEKEPFLHTLSATLLIDATHCFIAAGNSCRSWKKQVRAHGRKRPSAPTTYYAQAASETTYMHEAGSAASRPTGKNGPDMETSALDCPNG